jgi:predicted O-methyltransferase YrrM
MDVVRPDAAFPHLVIGDRDGVSWPYFRREIPHNWYVDARYPRCGVLSRDEASILYNTALAMSGRMALEIGCWKGWSTCHLLAGGVDLDVIDPLLDRDEFRRDVSAAIDWVHSDLGVAARVNLCAGASPDAVDRLAAEGRGPWSLIFIDGSHDAPAPRLDATAADRHASPDALVLLHDLAAPDVAEGLVYLADRGWQTAVYHTMQLMGVAWRGRVRPLAHQPDPRVNWSLPDHLSGFCLAPSPGDARGG